MFSHPILAATPQMHSQCLRPAGLGGDLVEKLQPSEWSLPVQNVDSDSALWESSIWAEFVSVLLYKFCQLAGLNFKHLLLQMSYCSPVIEAWISEGPKIDYSPQGLIKIYCFLGLYLAGWFETGGSVTAWFRRHCCDSATEMKFQLEHSSRHP